MACFWINKNTYCLNKKLEKSIAGNCISTHIEICKTKSNSQNCSILKNLHKLFRLKLKNKSWKEWEKTFQYSLIFKYRLLPAVNFSLPVASLGQRVACNLFRRVRISLWKVARIETLIDYPFRFCATSAEAHVWHIPHEWKFNIALSFTTDFYFCTNSSRKLLIITWSRSN